MVAQEDPTAPDPIVVIEEEAVVEPTEPSESEEAEPEDTVPYWGPMGPEPTESPEAEEPSGTDTEVNVAQPVDPASETRPGVSPPPDLSDIWE